MLVCQAEEREESRDPTQSEGTYPVTSLVDWRQASWGRRRWRIVVRQWRKAKCAWTDHKVKIMNKKKGKLKLETKKNTKQMD